MVVAAAIAMRLAVITYMGPRMISDFCTPLQPGDSPSICPAVKNFFIRTSDKFIEKVGRRNWQLFSEIVIENAWISAFVVVLLFPAAAPLSWLLALKVTVGFLGLNYCIRDFRNKVAEIFAQSDPDISRFFAHRYDRTYDPPPEPLPNVDYGAFARHLRRRHRELLGLPPLLPRIPAPINVIVWPSSRVGRPAVRSYRSNRGGAL